MRDAIWVVGAALLGIIYIALPPLDDWAWVRKLIATLFGGAAALVLASIFKLYTGDELVPWLSRHIEGPLCQIHAFEHCKEPPPKPANVRPVPTAPADPPAGPVAVPPTGGDHPKPPPVTVVTPPPPTVKAPTSDPKAALLAEIAQRSPQYRVLADFPQVLLVLTCEAHSQRSPKMEANLYAYLADVNGAGSHLTLHINESGIGLEDAPYEFEAKPNGRFFLHDPFPKDVGLFARTADRDAPLLLEWQLPNRFTQKVELVEGAKPIVNLLRSCTGRSS